MNEQRKMGQRYIKMRKGSYVSKERDTEQVIEKKVISSMERRKMLKVKCKR